MAIRKSTAFTASDGSLCATLEEAQRHELAIIALDHLKSNRGHEEVTETAKDIERNQAIEFAHLVFDNADVILDILTTGPRSRPAARKSKGTTNPKRAAKATPDVAKAGFKAMRAAVSTEVPEGTFDATPVTT